MSDEPRTRVTDKKLERAARIAKEQGVRVRVGDFVIDPPGAANDDANSPEAVEARMRAMSGGAKR